MALLTLKDVGKIYVSEGSVAVGIRGVNLSFDRGEFVAVTGKSGSGKSTLLNVISGMDSYEEGELLIEGQPTSHYLQPEWEEYREKYISFIFQDYNIIESFTVLQNVELALMHVEDKRERRRRALELLERVGLSGQIRQKGSKLSGGQKQRTVIARALAKDSPIILADEPTGNLDSATSAEIIALLREVSRDKLLIVVTHNFEEVEEAATRHVRVFDGAIESDRIFSRPQASEIQKNENASANRKKTKDFKNGLTLGRSIFTAKPRLSIFLCLLMIVGALGIFFVTTLCGEANEAFAPNYMFEHIEGRLVLTRQNGTVMTDEELATLMEEYGAKDCLHYDVLLDSGYFSGVRFRSSEGYHKSIAALPTYGDTFGDSILGRYPTAPNEVFLYLPISYQTEFGKETLLVDRVEYLSVALRVTGVAYYYDNNRTAKCLFTDEGFRNMTAVYYLTGQSSVTASIKLADGGNKMLDLKVNNLSPSYEVERGKLYIAESEYQKAKAKYASRNPQTTVTLSSTYYKYDWYWSNASQSTVFQQEFTDSALTDVAPEIPKEFVSYRTYGVMICPSLLREMAEGVLANSYRQASLFFADDKAAHEAAERLNAAGYIAVPSDTTYALTSDSAIFNLITALVLMVLWILAIVFLAFFINLCSARAIGSFKGDMAIMRSMGIPVQVIRVGMYVRMLLSIIPAYVFVAAVAITVFTVPKWNGFFVFLYPWQYVLIGVGILVLTLRITHRQVRRLFGESVKKSLRGGATE